MKKNKNHERADKTVDELKAHTRVWQLTKEKLKRRYVQNSTSDFEKPLIDNEERAMPYSSDESRVERDAKIKAQLDRFSSSANIMPHQGARITGSILSSTTGFGSQQIPPYQKGQQRTELR